MIGYSIFTYSIYLLVSTYITIWVGHRFYRNGEVFLKEIFRNDTSIVKPINKILLVGYYLINIGYVFVLMMFSRPLSGFTGMLELLSEKIGIVIITLAIIHVFNLTTFFIIYKYSKS